MPLSDTFPQTLRSETEAALEAQLEEVFDTAAVRMSLASRRDALAAELQQVCVPGSSCGHGLSLQEGVGALLTMGEWADGWTSGGCLGGWMAFVCVAVRHAAPRNMQSRGNMTQRGVNIV
eukprot:225025-Chlamydomonas_euryale.AAC.1